ncbi:hypothetical protein HYC85_014626 [Camellia sinensis]|uniref:Leucine-rich repeat-containing N-terminal plant-type domain-containing protein n=1 Tax=Camellia sinensis TaxID=4442 RepID=A0A7J7H714_CAMSI|nr:hypothetical protein HYC85_014626 [Camellia sinensis]
MSSRLLASLTVIILLAAVASEFTLPLSEVEALKEIGKSLGKNDWNFRALKALNLSGVLPRELCYCRALFGNRITGSIPKELGNITTLESIVLEFNQMSGPLPQELGNLTRLQKLSLTSNYFYGELPGTLAKLTTLKDLDLSFNKLSGEIPSNFVNPSASISMYGLLILVFGFLVPVLVVDSLKPPKLNSLTDDFE